MTLFSQVVFTTVVISSIIYKVTAINCYYCNSANNSACVNFKELDDELRGRLIPTVHCETAIPSPVSKNFFCRKIVQTIFHSHRDSEVRVTRGCGWVQHHRECYKADNQDHLETVCQCFTDRCNGSDHVDPIAMSGLFLLLSTVLFFYR